VHSRPKHVEKRNKHTKKNCAPSWLYLQDYTGMYSQQNIKLVGGLEINLIWAPLAISHSCTDLEDGFWNSGTFTWSLI